MTGKSYSSGKFNWMMGASESKLFRIDPILILAVVIALALPLIVIIVFRPYVVPPGNFASEMGEVARSVARGQGFSSPVGIPTGPTAWFAPAYPLLLATLFKIFGIYTETAAIAAYALNAIFQAALCLLAYWAAMPILGRTTARLSAWLVALYPQAIYLAGTYIWDTSLLVAALALVVGLALRMEIQAHIAIVFTCGLAMGATLLINPAPLPFFTFLIAWRLLQEWGKPNAIRNIALLILVPSALFGPWMVRNYVTTGAFTPRCCAGLELMSYNVDGASHPWISSEERQLYKTLGENDYNYICFQRAKKAIVADPAKYALRVLERIRDWWLGGEPKEYVKHLHGLGNVNLLMHTVVAGMLLFAVVGAWEAIRGGAKILPLIALLIVFPLPYYFINVTDRYAFPMRMIALLLTAHGLVSVSKWLRRSRWAMADQTAPTL